MGTTGAGYRRRMGDERAGQRGGGGPLREALRARGRPELNLAGFPTDATPVQGDKSAAKAELRGPLGDRLHDLHDRLLANADRAALLVLQGTDASGKNGTIKKVVRHVNPACVRVTSFTVPTPEERGHHWLWRIRAALPAPGQLAVFDRSHYEDVLVPRVERRLDPDAVAERLEEIRAFERELAADGTVVVKCLLHLSYDEQRERLLRRLQRPDKRWKFDPGDLEARARWDDFQAAYGEVLAATDADHAPWYVVPADRKWYRNWAVARLLVETLEELDLRYPDPDLDLEALRSRLEPPG